jgi:amidase
MIRDEEVSCREVLAAHLEQIERVNPSVNAIVTLIEDEARAAADEADRRIANPGTDGRPIGPLHGLPVVVKDLEPVAGVRTTFGSRVYEHHVPDVNALFVDRILDAGAILIGKSNTPEFGAGSQTFNEVFGRTRNPYDLSKTCGGSSGGAAVAVACGMASLADGSDLGGSLRNPPSYCNVVGLRPSPGRVPRWPCATPWSPLSVLGPIARSCEDAALLLSVMAGEDSRDPLSIAAKGASLSPPLPVPEPKDVRVAFSADLGGLPVAAEVFEVVESAVDVFRDLGARVEEGHPDFDGASEAFQVLRAQLFAETYGAELGNPKSRDLLKDTVVWNIEKGLSLTSKEIGEAERIRARIYENARLFLETYDFFVCPVSQVAPFPIEQEWIEEINGVRMETYIDWMKSAFFISLTALPALSVPAGFTPDGLPVGLQIVGRYRSERETLALGALFERETGYARRRPPIALDARA